MPAARRPRGTRTTARAVSAGLCAVLVALAGVAIWGGLSVERSTALLERSGDLVEAYLALTRAVAVQDAAEELFAQRTRRRSRAQFERAGADIADALRSSQARIRLTLISVLLGLLVMAALWTVLRSLRLRIDGAREEELERPERATLTDSLTGIRDHRAFVEDPAGPSRTGTGTATGAVSCCSTSTISRRSTTPTATRPGPRDQGRRGHALGHCARERGRLQDRRRRVRRPAARDDGVGRLQRPRHGPPGDRRSRGRPPPPRHPRLGAGPRGRRRGLLYVGKIGVPDAILQKPARLGADEYEIIKTHSVLGHKILHGTDLSREAPWVLHHHERIDGGGYPGGLAGEEIPLESRIIHVTDAFEAMTSDRPYRRGMPEQDAPDERRRHARTQFDPAGVDALLRGLALEPAAVTSMPAPQPPRDPVPAR